MIRILVVSLALAVPFGGPAHWWTAKGNRAYEERRYEDALQGYAEAQAHAPEAAELQYDIGNVRYRQEDYAGAADSYRRALESAGGELAADAAYNLGNAMFRQQDYPAAIDAYRRALAERPGDEDALRNLEHALRLREQPPPEQQPQSPEDPNEDEQEQEQPQSQPSPDESSEDQEQPRPQPQPESMSQEQAERLLDALRDAEAERKQEEQQKKKPGRRPTKEKDW